MDDDEAMLTLVLGPTDVALPIVVVVDVLLLICCDNVLTDGGMGTADVKLVVAVPEDVYVVEAVDDVPVDVLAVVLRPLAALVSDTDQLDYGDMLALDCVLLRGVELGSTTACNQ